MVKWVRRWVEGVGVESRDKIFMVIIITYNIIMMKCASFQFIPNTELLLKTPKMCEMQLLWHCFLLYIRNLKYGSEF